MWGKSDEFPGFNDTEVGFGPLYKVKAFLFDFKLFSEFDRGVQAVSLMQVAFGLRRCP